jgi:hypothetical protein
VFHSPFYLHFELVSFWGGWRFFRGFGFVAKQITIILEKPTRHDSERIYDEVLAGGVRDVDIMR